MAEPDTEAHGACQVIMDTSEGSEACCTLPGNDSESISPEPSTCGLGVGPTDETTVLDSRPSPRRSNWSTVWLRFPHQAKLPDSACACARPSEHCHLHSEFSPIPQPGPS